jgi:serine protease Do
MRRWPVFTCASLAVLTAVTACTPPGQRPQSTVQSSGITLDHSSGPTSLGSLDPAQVRAVLGPAVALVIVNTRSGGAMEGSAFGVSTSSTTTYMLTNNHVVEGAAKVQVLMPSGDHFTVEVAGADRIRDIAVLRVSARLPLARLADSGRLSVGQPVVAIGSALGAQNQGSLTEGIISGLHRAVAASGPNGTSSEAFGDLIQTDAPINAGNSGGPLADARGLVIGMNTATSTRGQDISYAIPSSMLKRVADELIAGRQPQHSYLGIAYYDEPNALLNGSSLPSFGIVVKNVTPSSPAERAGIKQGDVIQQFGATQLRNGETLGALLEQHNPDDRVTVKLVRDGAPLKLDVTLGRLPSGTT